MASPQQRWILLGAFLAMGTAAGCSGPRKADAGGPTELPGRRNTYVADIPLPEGFSMNESKSSNKVLASPQVRWVDHVYEGGKDPLAVRNFYAMNMANFQWQPIVDTANKGVYTMKYKKGIEVCEITVSRGGTGKFWAPTAIHVVLEPQQEGAAPSHQPK